MEGLQIVEYGDVRVLTTQQLADAYETDNKVISYNFNHNKERYREGEHYIVLTGDDLRAFREIHDLPSNVNKAYLWTEKGAFLHAKSLNTDKAWEVYDRLVESYFKTRQTAIDYSQLPPDMQMARHLWETQAKMYIEQQRQAALLDQQGTRLGELEASQKAVVDTFKKDADKSFRSWVTACINRIVDSTSFHRGIDRSDKYHMAYTESYERLNKKKRCLLNARVEHEKVRAAKAGATRDEVRRINKLTIIEKDKTLRPIYETVLKEMMLAYCVVV